MLTQTMNASQLLLSRPPVLKAVRLGAVARPHRRPVLCKGAENDDKPVDAINSLLSEADALMEEVGVNKGLPAKEVEEAAESDEPRMTLHCDVNGCTIAPVVNEASANKGLLGTRLGGDDTDASDSDILLIEGQGWKMGYNRNPSACNAYSAFVGGDGWSISLTPEEYEDFIQVLQNLRQSVATLEICGEWDQEGSAEATLEMSTPRIWMQGRAAHRQLSVLQRLWSSQDADDEKLPNVAFSLRFLVTSSGSREVEGFWPDQVVMSVLRHLDDDDDREVHVNGGKEGASGSILLGAE